MTCRNFTSKHKMEVVSSLPFYTQDRTDRQRGNGVFEDSIKALQMLNDVGYGKEGTGLILNLVYNPAGAFLPPSQHALEKEYKTGIERTIMTLHSTIYLQSPIFLSAGFWIISCKVAIMKTIWKSW